MVIKSVQKVIKIGSSLGVTLPAKELKRAGISAGEDVEIVITKITPDISDDQVLQAAIELLKKHKNTN